MKILFGSVLSILLFIAFQLQTTETEKPHIAFSFDDGSTRNILSYDNSEWNGMIRKQLSDNNVKAVWFVAGNSINNDKGKDLLQKWNDEGHIIANHTYHHYNYNDSLMTCKKYTEDILKCDSLISDYSNYRKIVRFPYLKGGNTILKRDSLNNFLKQKGYEQGWVSIDNCEWYINMRLIRKLKKDPNTDISEFRDYYVDHLFEMAQHYKKLSTEINKRQLKHVLLLHINLTSALFLNDLIEKFRNQGWIIDNYSDAINDPIYSEHPAAMPAEQSLIWMQANEKGGYDLRYPAESSLYHESKMDTLGL